MTVPSDAAIAIELAAELIAAQRVAPFKFGIYYDAKKEPARVTVHRVIKGGTMGAVEFAAILPARRWCEDALNEGYTVVRFMYGGMENVASVALHKRHLERLEKRAAMTPEQIKEIDDEIPF